MNKWKVILTQTTKKELNKLSHQHQSLIRNYLYTRILELDHPNQSGKVLRYNLKRLWRYRVDKFRIVCDLQEDKLVVLVVKIAKRDIVYED